MRSSVINLHIFALVFSTISASANQDRSDAIKRCLDDNFTFRKTTWNQSIEQDAPAKQVGIGSWLLTDQWQLTAMPCMHAVWRSRQYGLPNGSHDLILQLLLSCLLIECQRCSTNAVRSTAQYQLPCICHLFRQSPARAKGGGNSRGWTQSCHLGIKSGFDWRLSDWRSFTRREWKKSNYVGVLGKGFTMYSLLG